jgi:tetratricopeptide (TPR) repeat protein
MILAVLNRHVEAIEVQKKATELDSFARPWALPRAFLWARQYDAALKEGLSRLEASPNVAGLSSIVSEIYWAKGMDKEAAQFLLKGLLLTEDKGSAASVQHAYEQGGYRALVVWQLRDLERQSKTHYVSPLNMAKLNAKLGDRERTISLLQQGLQKRSPGVLWIQCEPAYDFLHSDPRYRAIIKQIGLPPAW